MAFSRICKARLRVLLVMLPHKERLDLFPLRTAPPKHGFWMRSKHFSVTHVLNFNKINRSYLRELQYFPPHTNIRPQPGCDTHIQGWRGALASFAFPHKLLVGMTGGCRAAAFLLSESLRWAGEPLAPQLTIWESQLYGWPPPCFWSRSATCWVWDWSTLSKFIFSPSVKRLKALI